MANLMHVPVLGIVENMSYISCPDCGKKIEVFGQSKVEALAKEYIIPAAARMPLDPNIAKFADDGRIEDYQTDALEEILAVIDKAERVDAE
jgi:hypothetical protein